MTASKKHRGLGRGLDALIPATGKTAGTKSYVDETNNDKTDNRNNSGNAENKSVLDASENTETDTGYVKIVRITAVEPDRDQARKQFNQSGLEALAESIKNKGLLEPILVQETGNHYTIIAGERRWRACKLAGLREIPVIVRNYDDLERAEVSLIENIQREDLNPIEEARAYQRLISEYHLTQEEIASRVSRDRSSVANSLRLLKLAEPVQEMVIDGRLSMGHARALITVEDPVRQEELAQKAVSLNMSVRDVEKMIRNMLRSGTEKRSEHKDEALETIYRDIESRMNSVLGMKVNIRSKGKKSGKLEIDFSSQDDLEKIMDLLLGQQEA